MSREKKLARANGGNGFPPTPPGERMGPGTLEKAFGEVAERMSPGRTQALNNLQMRVLSGEAGAAQAYTRWKDYRFSGGLTNRGK